MFATLETRQEVPAPGLTGNTNEFASKDNTANTRSDAANRPITEQLYSSTLNVVVLTATDRHMHAPLPARAGGFEEDRGTGGGDENLGMILRTNSYG